MLLSRSLRLEMIERYAPGHQIDGEFVEPIWLNAVATIENLAEYLDLTPSPRWVERNAYRLVIKALDAVLHGDGIDLTCACGQFPLEEYGTHCPSCTLP